MLNYLVAGSQASVWLSVRHNHAGSGYIPTWRNKFDWLLSEFCDSKIESTLLLKSAFVGLRVAELNPVASHTHGVSAAKRGTASLLIDRLAASTGMRAVFYQSSRADSRNGRVGARTYYWAKDLVAHYDNVLQEEGDLAVMVDVDYYVNMNKFLCEKFVPTVLYTCVPSAAAGVQGDYKYTFTPDNKLLYTVSGGGCYEHELWDWSGDSVVTEQWLFGIIPWRRAVYAIERRQMDKDHQLILLAPLKRWCGPIMVLLSRWFSRGHQLERLRPVCGEFTRLMVNSSTDMLVSTSTPLSYLAATVPAATDDAIHFASKTGSGKLTAYTVKSKMELEAGNTVGYEVLHAYHLGTCSSSRRVDVLEPYVQRFQWIGKGGYNPDAKPGMVAFMKPIIDGGFVPDSCEGNDERAVQKRIVDLKKSPQTLDVFVSKVMDEYVELFWNGERWSRHPMENEDVYERQARPTQRKILDQAQHENPTKLTRQFMKREAYQQPNDPRIISTINGVDKMAFSAFVYTVAEQQKTHPWYAFGKTPREVAKRVVEVCLNATVVAQTDCSRMDGNYDERANELHRRIFAYGFHRKYHVQLFEMMSRMVDMRGVTTYGVRCAVGQAEASGKPSTALDNSNLNAFMAFLGYRKTVNPNTGTYYNKQEAWDMLGIYAGDDGLSRDYVEEKMISAASCMGQVLKLEGIKRGESGLMFLARRYGPDVWFGDPVSICDLPRQLSKFHLTVALPSNITRERKLCEKAFAFALTDRNTPIIGEFVKRVAVLFPKLYPKFENKLNIWGLEMNPGEQYPNDYADWMEADTMRVLPEFDREKFAAWLSGTDERTIFEIAQCMDRVPPRPKEPVVVNGDLVQPEPKQQTPKTSPKAQKQRGRVAARPRKPKSERPSRNGTQKPRGDAP